MITGCLYQQTQPPGRPLSNSSLSCRRLAFDWHIVNGDFFSCWHACLMSRSFCLSACGCWLWHDFFLCVFACVVTTGVISIELNVTDSPAPIRAALHPNVDFLFPFVFRRLCLFFFFVKTNKPSSNQISHRQLLINVDSHPSRLDVSQRENKGSRFSERWHWWIVTRFFQIDFHSTPTQRGLFFIWKIFLFSIHCKFGRNCESQTRTHTTPTF